MKPVPETENADLPLLTAQKKPLNLSPQTWGWLRDSSDLFADLGDPDAGDTLRARMDEDGYLFLPGLLDRARVINARREIVNRLASANALAPSTDPMDAVAPPKGQASYFRPDLSDNNAALHDILYRGRMREFFGLLFGETAQAVRPFDLSSDTRYQKASRPIDERWINGPRGEKAIGHGLAAKRGRIC